MFFFLGTRASAVSVVRVASNLGKKKSAPKNTLRKANPFSFVRGLAVVVAVLAPRGGVRARAGGARTRLLTVGQAGAREERDRLFAAHGDRRGRGRDPSVAHALRRFSPVRVHEARSQASGVTLASRATLGVAVLAPARLLRESDAAGAAVHRAIHRVHGDARRETGRARVGRRTTHERGGREKKFFTSISMRAHLRFVVSTDLFHSSARGPRGARAGDVEARASPRHDALWSQGTSSTTSRRRVAAAPATPPSIATRRCRTTSCCAISCRAA